MSYFYENNKPVAEPQKTHTHREFVILEEITRQPGIHHNALREAIVGRGEMAGNTFTRIMSTLIKEGRVQVEQDKNKKRYTIPGVTINSVDFKKDISAGESIADHHLNRLRNEYSSLPIVDKAMMATFAFKACADTLRVIAVSGIFVEKSKGNVVLEGKLKEMIREILEMVKKDEKSDLVLPLLKTNMLQDETLQAMSDMFSRVPPDPGKYKGDAP